MIKFHSIVRQVDGPQAGDTLAAYGLKRKPGQVQLNHTSELLTILRNFF